MCGLLVSVVGLLEAAGHRKWWAGCFAVSAFGVLSGLYGVVTLFAGC